MYLARRKTSVFDGMHEECGVFGVYSAARRATWAHTVYYGLYALQHRGQESCRHRRGLRGQNSSIIRAWGLIPEGCSGKRTPGRPCPKGTSPSGTCAIRRRGRASLVNAQPIVFTGKCGKMAVAHNGNLTKTDQPARRAHRGQRGLSDERGFGSDGACSSIRFQRRGHRAGRVEGVRPLSRVPIALVVMTADKLIAVRDPYRYPPARASGKSPGRHRRRVRERARMDAVGAHFRRARRESRARCVVIDCGRGCTRYPHSG